MRNQSASVPGSWKLGTGSWHRQTTPTANSHDIVVVVVILGVWLQRISSASLSFSPPLLLLSVWAVAPQLCCASLARSQPVRHNEHHCVLSAFVVSCSLSLSLGLLLTCPLPLPFPLPGSARSGLFIYSFSCPSASFQQPSAAAVTFLASAWPCTSVCLESLVLGQQESGQRPGQTLYHCPRAATSYSHPRPSSHCQWKAFSN